MLLMIFMDSFRLIRNILYLQPATFNFQPSAAGGTPNSSLPTYKKVRPRKGPGARSREANTCMFTILNCHLSRQTAFLRIWAVATGCHQLLLREHR